MTMNHSCREKRCIDYHVVADNDQKWYLALSVADGNSEATFCSKEIFFCPWCGKKLSELSEEGD